MPRIGLALLVALLVGAALPAAAAEAGAVRALEATLAEMHPDYRDFIGAVRAFPRGATPRNVYMGLVRPGGADPRRSEDAPEPGRARRYDLLVAGDDALGSAEWSRLLLDHEYLHARHLAYADRLPSPAFGRAAADRHFHEALAWGYNLARARQGAYGALPERRLQEAQERYRAHRDAVRSFVLRRQPAVWAYYERFLPDDRETVRVSSAEMR